MVGENLHQFFISITVCMRKFIVFVDSEMAEQEEICLQKEFSMQIDVDLRVMDLC